MKYLIIVFAVMLCIFGVIFLFGSEWGQGIVDAAKNAGTEDSPAVIDMLFN